MNTLKVVLIIGAAGFGLSGCSFPSAGKTVPRSQVGVLRHLSLGRVVDVKKVTIEGSRTYLGPVAGSAAGSAAGLGAASGSSNGVAIGASSAAGAAVGAVVGGAVEELATRKQGQEITVLMDSGVTVVIVQDADTGYFQQGDRVQVAQGGGMATVRIAMN